MKPPLLDLDRPFRLGSAIVDPTDRTVALGESRSRLDLKAMQVLRRLAEEPGEVVSKEALFARVWPNQAVTDEVLPVAVHALRKVLGDDAARPSYIETVPKAGYRLLEEPRPVGSGSNALRRLAVLAAVGVSLALLAAALGRGRTTENDGPYRAAPTPLVVETFHAVAGPFDPGGSGHALATTIPRAVATSLARDPALAVVTEAPAGDAVHRLTGMLEHLPDGAVRLTAQLRDPGGRVLWGSTLDGSPQDPADLQDRLIEVVRRGAVPTLRKGAQRAP